MKLYKLFAIALAKMILVAGTASPTVPQTLSFTETIQYSTSSNTLPSGTVDISRSLITPFTTERIVDTRQGIVVCSCAFMCTSGAFSSAVDAYVCGL